MIPNGLKRLAGVACCQKDSDHSKPPVGVLMNEVKFHLVEAAVDGVLAGGVEVELHQVIAMPADGDRTAFRAIHLNGTAVVRNRQGSCLVGEEDGYKTTNYNGLIPVLIEAVNEQQKLIEELKYEIEQLKNK